MDFEYQCIECGRRYDVGSEIIYVCPVCSLNQKPMEPLRGALRIILPYQSLAERLSNYAFTPKDFLPLDCDTVHGYGVGNTPLIEHKGIQAEQKFPNLLIKNDSVNPTGSFKDRASLIVAALAFKANISRIVVASTGNAASAMAGIAAFCGLECIIFVPYDAPKAKLVQSIIYGAKVVPLKGNYDEAFEISLEFTRIFGGINRNTAYNPFTIEGKKTAAIEIFYQLDYRVPDYMYIPTGDGAIISGIYKGFYDLYQLDLIDYVPQLIAVQAEGSNAIVQGISSGKIVPIENAHSIADSICVSAPRNGIMALKDIKSSGGFGVTVTDDEIIEAQQYLGNKAGLFVEPAAASAFAGFLKSKDKLDKDANVIVLLTGSGLKDIQTTLEHLEIPKPVEPDIEKIAKKLSL